MQRSTKIDSLIPKVSSDRAQTLLGNSEEWRNFGRRIQRHPYVLERLKSLQEHRCPVCSCGLEGAVTIHHVSYINRCVTSASIEVSNPTEKRSNKTVAAPPCEGCPSLERCLGFLALVHNACHVKIHAREKAHQS